MRLAIGSCGLSIVAVAVGVTLLGVGACGVIETPAAPAAVEVVTAALNSSGDGDAYASQCSANHVPLPIPWGPDTLGTGPGKWDQTGHMYPGDPWLTPKTKAISSRWSRQPEVPLGSARSSFTSTGCSR
jgi:hypothetical protein